MYGDSDSHADLDDDDLTYRVLKTLQLAMDSWLIEFVQVSTVWSNSGLLFKKCKYVEPCWSMRHEMQVTLGSNGVIRFGDGLQQAGLSEVDVLVVDEPLGCRRLNFTAIPGEHNDAPPLLGTDFHRGMKGGVIIASSHDDLQRA